MGTGFNPLTPGLMLPGEFCPALIIINCGHYRFVSYFTIAICTFFHGRFSSLLAILTTIGDGRLLADTSRQKSPVDA
jgi:hypothetical protein